MKARFNLKDSSKNGRTPIYLIARYEGHKFKYGISISVDPRNWNSEEMRVRRSRNVPNYKEINQRLTKIANEIERYYLESLNKDIYINNDLLRNHMNRFLGKSASLPEDTFYGFFEKFVQKRDQDMTLQKSAKYYPKRTLELVRKYDTFRRHKTEFKNINMDWYNGFIDFLYGPEVGISTNYAGNIIKNLKLVLNDALLHGINHNRSFQQKAFKKPNEKTDDIYLNEQELNLLYHFDFSEHPRLDKVRDLFLIGCDTGLRFSDYSQITPVNLITEGGNRFLRIRTQKTGEVVHIPLKPRVLDIMSKYKGLVPERISNQKFNDYIKEVCRKAGVVQHTESSKPNKGKRVKLSVPKYKLVSSHTARRSFATNAYLSGIEPIGIMRITGHKTEKAFLKYLKMDSKENAIQISGHEFFKGGKLSIAQ